VWLLKANEANIREKQLEKRVWKMKIKS
jgi:hypothetical protein